MIYLADNKIITRQNLLKIVYLANNKCRGEKSIVLIILSGYALGVPRFLWGSALPAGENHYMG